jgi:hypothetical protein
MIEPRTNCYIPNNMRKSKPYLISRADGMYLTDNKTFFNYKIYSIEPHSINQENEFQSFLIVLFDKLNEFYTYWNNYYDSIRNRFFNQYQPIPSLNETDIPIDDYYIDSVH